MPAINAITEAARTGSYAGSYPAGREGVVNKDIHGKLRWEFAPMQALEFETGYSRQGNLYAGDTQNTNTSTLVKSLYGERDQPPLSPDVWRHVDRRLG